VLARSVSTGCCGRLTVCSSVPGDGIPAGGHAQGRDDNGAALAYYVFLALFPLLLVVVAVLGFLLGRDSRFQQRLLGSAVAKFPSHRRSGAGQHPGAARQRIGLVVGLVAFAWGARGLTQVAQHAMAESGTPATSDPASGPGRSVGCCWWSLPLAWLRRAC
jgi:Virulence factor BrkB